MTLSDPIGDMITRIRNAQLRALYNVEIPGSKFRERILDVLKQEGYISNYKVQSDEKNKNSALPIRLSYETYPTWSKKRESSELSLLSPIKK